jgi:hypothetical protein
MPGLALWQGSGRGAGEAPVELSTEIDIILDEDFDPTRKLVLAAFDVTSVGGDFVSLSFGIDVNGAAIGDDESFGDAAAAAAFFQDRVFDLGLGLVGGDEVRVRLALTIGGESSFGSGLAYGTVVPEPGTGLLLGFGLLLLPARGAARRR